jgi:hypothetical protein
VIWIVLRRHMNFKSFKNTQPTPLVALFAVVTTLLAASFVYQKFFSAGVIDFSPAMMWLAVAIPAGIFGCIFLQVRAAERTQQVAQQVHARITELESESRGGIDSRRASSPNLDRPITNKDPFENL